MSRQGNEIRAWCKRRGIVFVKVAERIGVDQSLIHHTLSGRANNRKVLRELVRLGVPRRFLALPQGFEEAA